MTYEERKALVKSYLGRTVDIKIDPPIGYVHKKEKYSLTYPINYGYIPGVLGGDGEELDRKIFRCDVNNAPCDSVLLPSGALIIAGRVSADENPFNLKFPLGVDASAALFIYK